MGIQFVTLHSRLPGLINKFNEETTMKKTVIRSASLACALLLNTTYSAAEQALEEVIVTAELIQANVLELPNSVTVIGEQAIERRNAQHLEDLLNLAPNVNFATGASRGRFIQVRGIGERSEFQDPIINSVGVVVDGIDMTGISTAASTLDVQQVEILRGPQGTLYGANALAGLINIVSNAPSENFSGKFSSTFEEFGGFGLEGAISGPTSDSSGYRLAVKHYQSDGFTEDVFLGRDDTNNIDETTARARYSTQISERLNLDFTVFVADIDNGYDAFSLDNTRQTFSDQPGVDRQETTAGSLNASYEISEDLQFEALLSIADSDLQYSYDEDWSHTGICDNTACDSALFGFDWFYSSTDEYFRDNKNTSLDLRIKSSDWVIGLYHRDQSIDLTRVYTFNDGDFLSQLDTVNTALYGQIKKSLTDNWAITGGLRFEQRDLDYADNSGQQVSPDEGLWGGRIALEYLSNSGALYYGLVSRGYKPGGFNLDGSLSAEQREFDTETMLNFELGFKQRFLNDSLSLQVALFHQDRDDIQTKQSIVRSQASGDVGGDCPCSFTDFTANAATGFNRGLEVELNWQANDRTAVFVNLGLLDTEFDDLLTFDNVNADLENGIPFNLNGREQAHAPSYQWVIGAAFNITEQLVFSGSVEAKDDFFFSDRHQERSDAYELLNLELAYQTENWEFSIYGKNLTDELVKTRGFGSFGNDPRNFYETEPYNQFAAPRVVGMRASIDF